MGALLFAAVTGIGIVIGSVPLCISRCALGFGRPPHSRLFQEVADFVSGPVLGSALAMVFRWVAMDLDVVVERTLDAASCLEREGRPRAATSVVQGNAERRARADSSRLTTLSPCPEL